jgi:hypothetical protein
MNEEEAGDVQRRKSGRKKLAFFIVLLAALVGGLIWLAMPPPEPSYQGKPLSYWLARCEENGGMQDDSKDPKIIECRDAILHIGTNGIPVLLRMLRATDSRLKTTITDLAGKQDFIHVPIHTAEEHNIKAEIGFQVLGDLATNAAPALIDICMQWEPCRREISSRSRQRQPNARARS